MSSRTSNSTGRSRCRWHSCEWRDVNRLRWCNRGCFLVFQALNSAVGGAPSGLQLQPSGHFTRLKRRQQQHTCVIIINYHDVCIIWTPQGFLPALKQVI